MKILFAFQRLADAFTMQHFAECSPVLLDRNENDRQRWAVTIGHCPVQSRIHFF